MKPKVQGAGCWGGKGGCAVKTQFLSSDELLNILQNLTKYCLCQKVLPDSGRRFYDLLKVYVIPEVGKVF